MPPDVGPYYMHLAAAKDLSQLRKLVEKKCLGHNLNEDHSNKEALRIVEVKYCVNVSESTLGCPIDKHKLKRKSEKEKFLILGPNHLPV